MATIGVTFVVARVWVSFELWKHIRNAFEYIRDHCDAISAVLNVAATLGMAAILVLLLIS